ncbi:ZIP family metal transporter [Thalassoroseus pseudoceratinae]|uniref:ZIP family metal transporter n=1 Tax=Thalassoroseus pseudoceratinae TaxID=2713176 RepID=UPI00141E008B|nr:ZIP family metal transporter [Thalassoroseus pseudoceratinae]
MQTTVLISVYCTLIVAASLTGGMLANRLKLSHTQMQMLLSGVGGFMLGIALFHLLPHSLHLTGSIHASTNWLAIGLMTMFFLIRAFHFHSHEPADSSELHDHDHDNGGHHAHSPIAHRWGWFGVTLGLALHTLIDGMALGADVAAQEDSPVRWSLFGFSTFLAILLHKPLDAVSITSLMAASGWSTTWRNVINFGFALMCPIGALAFFLGVQAFGAEHQFIVGCALGFSAGVFLCISLGDLLPEVELHSHHRIQLSLVLLLGMGLAWVIELTHSHPPRQPPLEIRSSLRIESEEPF